MRTLFLLFLIVSQLVSAQQKQLSLEDAVWGRYTYLNPVSQQYAWKNNNTLSYLKNDTLWLADAKSGNTSPAVSLAGLKPVFAEIKHELMRFPAFSWLETEKLLLQSSGKYFIFNMNEKQIEAIIEPAPNAQNAVFSEKGQFVVYTVNDDLFVSFASKKTLQITADGGNGIVNGQSVHRNEFGISGGIFISPAGNYIAFYRKDESMVHDYPLVDFMAREAEYTPVKYPMAGLASEQVKLGVYHIESGKTIFLKTGEPLDHYLTNIVWSPHEKHIYIAELNRGQNHMQLNCYEAATGEKVKTLFEEKHEKYVEPLHPLQFSKQNQNEFYYMSRKDGWFHVYKYNTRGELLRQITNGNWEVTRILGFDEQEKYMFFEGTKENPLEIHIYRVEIKSGKIDKLSETEGIHHGDLSPLGDYLVDSWSGTLVPGEVDLLSSKGKVLRNLFTAENTLEAYVLGENRLVNIVSADGNTALTGRLILPPDFDATKKYPVIVYVYGGPHSQLVNKGWHNSARWWQYYMASKGYIAFTIDNRGTSNRGREFETAVHRQLGILETEDQIKGIEYLKTLPYVDAERVGVHGWSYGGFMTLNLMLRHPETFKVGVAGGPVVDWSMYEVMYGERYMDTPQENPKGYQETNMLNHVSNLSGKLMLIHGVQDQTVVMQHSMKFLRECVKKGKQVDFFVYPTHPHNVRGKERIHLMEKVSSYFFDNL